MPDVSVVVCCYNSRNRIEKTLRALAAQKLHSTAKFEIILVDNCSTDQTKEFAEQLWNSLDTNIRLMLVTEDQAGLSYARKRGVACSSSPIILFCDDDNSFNPHYIDRILQCFKDDVSKEIGIIGGTGTGIAESGELPEWFSKVQGRYAVGCPLEKSGYVTNVYGAGMAIRKEVFDAIEESGFRSRMTDRKGNSLASGGDSEVCFAAQLCGYRVWWLIDNTFEHYIPSGRLTPEYLRRRFDSEGATQAALIGLNALIDPRPIFQIQERFKSDFSQLIRKFLSALKHGQMMFYRLWLREKYNFWKFYLVNRTTINASYKRAFWFDGK